MLASKISDEIANEIGDLVGVAGRLMRVHFAAQKRTLRDVWLMSG